MTMTSVDLNPYTAEKIPPGRQLIRINEEEFFVRSRRRLKNGLVRFYVERVSTTS
jgi:hypothetical protein